MYLILQLCLRWMPLSNGMKYDELIKGLDLLIKPELFGIDVVEFVPDNDSSGKVKKL